MSLARSLVSGGYAGFSVDATKYNHDDGALRISMESTEELHEIFMESFYNVEQADMAAVREGVALEGSQYEAVAEAAIANAFSKVKDFFKKLWEKVKGFFHNVKRYLDSIFMSGREFCKKYKNDIDKISDLDGFEFKMFKYDDNTIDRYAESMTNLVAGINASVDKSTGELKKDIIDALNMASSNSEDTEVLAAFEKAGTKALTDLNSYKDSDTLAKKMAPALGLSGVDNVDDLKDKVYELLRDGESEKDEYEVSVSDIKYMSNTLQNSKHISKFDSSTKKMNKAFADAIKLVDKASKYPDEFTDIDVSDKYRNGARAILSKFLSEYSSGFSHAQTLCNTIMSIWKTAINERDGAYKSCIVAALSHDKKQKKKEK